MQSQDFIRERWAQNGFLQPTYLYGYCDKKWYLTVEDKVVRNNSLGTAGNIKFTTIITFMSLDSGNNDIFVIVADKCTPMPSNNPMYYDISDKERLKSLACSKEKGLRKISPVEFFIINTIKPLIALSK